MRKYLIACLVLIITFAVIGSSCRHKDMYQQLQKDLSKFTEDKDATIGIAVIIDGKDTISVNGDKSFPMLSVYKLPIAIAFGEHLTANNGSLSDSITITQADLKPDTYSPMRDEYAGVDSIRLSLRELVAYAMQQSDNNASDILLKIMGGVDRAMNVLNTLGIKNVNISATEAEMYENPALCYQNSTTPIAMAKMIDEFDDRYNDAYAREVKQIMETCMTGKNRLAQPLISSCAVIGHKTGTGFVLPDGRLMAVNDAGYVHLPDGNHYSIAVFVENSGYDMEQTEKLIADISNFVFKCLK